MAQNTSVNACASYVQATAADTRADGEWLIATGSALASTCIKMTKRAEHELTLQDDLAQNVSLEQGKTLPDARGDVFRGLGIQPAHAHSSAADACNLSSTQA